MTTLLLYLTLALAASHERAPAGREAVAASSIHCLRSMPLWKYVREHLGRSSDESVLVAADQLPPEERSTPNSKDEWYVIVLSRDHPRAFAYRVFVEGKRISSIDDVGYELVLEKGRWQVIEGQGGTYDYRVVSRFVAATLSKKSAHEVAPKSSVTSQCPDPS